MKLASIGMSNAINRILERYDETIGSLITVFLLIVSIECLQMIGARAVSLALLIVYISLSSLCLSVEAKRSSAKLSDLPKYLYLAFDVIAIVIAVELGIEGAVSFSQISITLILAILFYVSVLINLILLARHFIRAVSNAGPRPSNGSICLVVLCAFVSFVLNIDCINAWPQYDSYAFVRGLDLKGVTSVLESNGLIMSGHITDSFAFLGLLIRLVLPTNAILDPLYESLNSLYVMNMLIAFFGMILISEILKALIRDRSDSFYVIMTLLFGVSPLFLGSSFMLFPDKLLLFGTILFVYSRIVSDEPIHLLALFIICTTKETGFVMAFVCSVFEVALTASVCLRDKRVSSAERIRIVYYVLALIIGIVIFARYAGSSWFSGDVTSRWTGVQSLDGKQWNSMALSGAQALVVLKATILSNFTWLFFIIIVIGIMLKVVLLKSASKGTRGMSDTTFHYIFILIMGASYIAGLCLFVTSVRWRYLMPTVFAIDILGLCALDFIVSSLRGKRWMTEVFSSIIACLLFVQCYITIDPVMLQSFTNISTGYTRMVALDQNCDFMNLTTLSPSSEYNRQVGTFAKALDKALEPVVDTETKQLFLFSNEHQILAQTSAQASIWGYGYASRNPPRWGHWSNELGQRVLTGEQDGAIEFSFINDIQDIEKYRGEYDDIYYIEMPWSDSIIEASDAQPAYKAAYFGWEFNVYSLQ